MNDFWLWSRVLRDSDGGGSGGGSGSSGASSGGAAGAAAGGKSSSSSGKGTSAAEGYAQAAQSMGEAGIGSVGGKDVGGSNSSGGRAGGVGSPGVGGGFDGSSGKSSAASSSASSSASGGRAGGVGSPSAGGGFFSAAGMDTGGGRAGAVGQPGVGGGFSSSTGTSPSAGYSQAASTMGSVGIGSVGGRDVGASSGGRAGGVGTPGVAGGFFSAATSPTVGYGLAAQTMGEVGIGSVGGRSVESRGMSMASSARAAENLSMSKYTSIQGLLGAIKSAEAHKVDPYNSLVYGKNTPTHADLTSMTIGQVMGLQKGMPSKGFASTAVGAYQMTKSTLAEAVSRTGLSLDAKFSKATQDYLALDLAQNRAEQATVNGKVDVGKFASKLANEWAGFASATGNSAYDGIAGNKSSVSRSAVEAIADSLVSTGAVAPGKGMTSAMKSDTAPTAPTTSTKSSVTSLPDVAPVPTSRPDVAALPDVAPVPTSRIGNFYTPPDESRFASRYLSPQPTSYPAGTVPGYQQAAESIGKTSALGIGGKTAPVGSMTGVFTGSTTQSTELSAAERSALDASVAPYGPNAPAATGYSPPSTSFRSAENQSMADLAAMQAATVATDEAPDPEYTPPDAYLTDPEDAQPTTVDETVDETAPEAPASVGSKIAATAIDIGIGMIPGIGIPASVVNGFLGLIGQPTLGQMAVDAIGPLGGSAATDPVGYSTGDGGIALDLSTTQAVAPTSTATTSGEARFESTYLGVNDNKKRPTPAEKWARDRSSYANREYA